MADPILTPAAKDEWAQLLDRIEASIARALDEAAAQEQTLADADGPVPSPEPRRVWRPFGWTTGALDAAGRLADAVEALLAADEEEARAWTDLAGRSAARLAIAATGARMMTVGHAPCREGSVMAKFAVILPAAGQSSRFKDKEKKAVRHARWPGRLAAHGRAFRHPVGCRPVPAGHRPGRPREVPDALHGQHRIYEREGRLRRP